MGRAMSMWGVLGGLLTACFLWLALPGGGEFWPILFLAMLPLFTVTIIENGRVRFFAGLAGGFFHFLMQMYWIVIVLRQYGGLSFALSVSGCAALALYLALYFALFCYFAGLVVKKLHSGYVLFFFPCLWVGLDWARSFFLTGLPWLDLGYGLWSNPYLLQIADLLGHYGLSFLVIMINTAIFCLFLKDDRLVKFVCVTVTILMTGAAVGYGKWRRDMVTHEMRKMPTAVVGAVQGNIAQGLKWSQDQQEKTVKTYLDSTFALTIDGRQPDLVVWPETALPFYPARSALFPQVVSFAKINKVNIITGAPWFQIGDEKKARVDYFNSAFVISSLGGVGDIYFKTHLVPFGEYVPLKNFFSFLAPLVENVSDFSSGTMMEPLVAGKVKAGMLICFESIFPDIARKSVRGGANLLVNLTNDAWYGRSSAPYQSMAMSVVRAVETRRSLVRAANTGVSAFVDPLGEVRMSSDIFVKWAEKAILPLMEHTSFYMEKGHYFPVVCLLVSLFIWGRAMMFPVRKRKHLLM